MAKMSLDIVFLMSVLFLLGIWIWDILIFVPELLKAQCLNLTYRNEILQPSAIGLETSVKGWAQSSSMGLGKCLQSAPHNSKA